ncbi:MAG TPA: glycosyltransferase, partial [Candidatus Acidoferrales bacterium]|nr:glycosyltransferase [Candidatus Acidoferrales bacterium]
RNETNLGHVRNFNKGITMASGKYVWLVSADDWLRSRDVLKRYVEVMEGNPEVGYVFCRGVEVQGSREIGLAQWTDCGEKDRIWDGRSFLMRLVEEDCVLLSAAMVRKECYDKHGLFSLEMPHANDWYMWCVLALHYQVAYLAEPMVFVRIHEQSLTAAFDQGGTPIWYVDNLKVLWEVARLAEQAGVISNRHAFNVSIARRAARALQSGPARSTRAGFSEADFEVLLVNNVRDSRDEEGLRACLYMAVGDEQFWHGQYKKAAQAYRQGLRLRPWWLRIWTKYLLLWTGGVGIGIRRFLLDLRQPGAKAT